ncbi:hypothetical protein CsSME_00043927 [Camellia sinensis var. sinensis]
MEPRVFEHMSQIIDMIKQILDNGCAYRIEGDVYFSVDKFPDYGQLSGPWGPGRPGWHIECSAMSAAY